MVNIFKSSPCSPSRVMEGLLGSEVPGPLVLEPLGGKLFLQLLSLQHLMSCLTSDSSLLVEACSRRRDAPGVGQQGPCVESKGAADGVSWKQAQRHRAACRVYWKCSQDLRL